MPYSANGDHVDPQDVLDQEEYASYRRARSERASYRLAHYARTGVLPRAVGEVTEDAVMDAYERHVQADPS